MADEPIGSEAAAGWSRRNVADVGIALIGFGLVISSADGLMALGAWVWMALFPGFEQYYDKGMRLAMCGSTFFQLFLGLWLIAHHRKISSRLFRAQPGAPVAERRTALAFGIKVYALYLAAHYAISPGGEASWEIRKALVFVGRGYQWYILLSWVPYPVMIAVCLYFLKRTGWLVSFAYPEGETDEDA